MSPLTWKSQNYKMDVIDEKILLVEKISKGKLPNRIGTSSRNNSLLRKMSMFIANNLQ
jgi:hypothetical protein